LQSGELQCSNQTKLDVEIKFTSENLKKIDEIKARYPTRAAALMSVLWIAQEQFG
jgi:NADH:ubiquinone oxidoreductase subunit E